MTRRPRRPPGSGRLPVVLYAHPFELAFGLILLLAGLRSTGVSGVHPVPFDTVLPGYVVTAYAAGGIIGGLAVLFGLAGRAHAFPRAVEKAGLYLVAGVFAAHAAALLLLPGFAGTLTALINLVIGAASFLRAEAIRLTEGIILEQLRAQAAGQADPSAITDLVDGTHEPRRLGRRRRRADGK